MQGFERRRELNLRRRIETPLGRQQNRNCLPETGRSTEATYLLAVRCPVYRGRDSSLGLRAELENLVCEGKGKATSRRPREAESTNAQARGELLRSSDEAG
jgi:hypothetical protein